MYIHSHYKTLYIYAYYIFYTHTYMCVHMHVVFCVSTMHFLTSRAHASMYCMQIGEIAEQRAKDSEAQVAWAATRPNSFFPRPYSPIEP